MEEFGKGKEQLEDESIPQIPGINLPNALNRLNHNVKLLHRLLHAFREDFANIIPQLRQMLGQNDISAARDLVHALKGTAGNLEMLAIMAAAKAVETALKQNDFTQARAALEHLAQTLQPTLQAIATLPGDSALPPIPEISSVTHLVPDMAQIQPLLLELDQDLKKHSLSARRQLSVLKTYLTEPAYQQILNEIDLNLQALNFKSARVALKTVAQRLKVDLPV